MTDVADAGLLAPVDPATIAQVEPAYVPSSKDWVGIAARSTVIVYNPSKIRESELPASLMDLADPKYAGRWGAAAGGADFQAIVSAILATQGEEKTAAWLAALKSDAKVYQNNIATMKAVNAGQSDLGVIYHYYWYRDQALSKASSGNT
jgi:iron(III) transport system substrate-binding protein